MASRRKQASDDDISIVALTKLGAEESAAIQEKRDEEVPASFSSKLKGTTWFADLAPAPYILGANFQTEVVAWIGTAKGAKRRDLDKKISLVYVAPKSTGTEALIAGYNEVRIVNLETGKSRPVPLPLARDDTAHTDKGAWSVLAVDFAIGDRVLVQTFSRVMMLDAKGKHLASSEPGDFARAGLGVCHGGRVLAVARQDRLDVLGTDGVTFKVLGRFGIPRAEVYVRPELDTKSIFVAKEGSKEWSELTRLEEAYARAFGDGRDGESAAARKKRQALESDLHGRIDESPASVDTYLVLADLLLQQGASARGELITLQHAAETKKKPGKRGKDPAKDAIDELIARIGPAAPKYGDWRWFCGFVSYVRNIIDEDDESQLIEYLAHPSLRHLQELDLAVGGSEYDDRQFVIDVITAAVRPALRRVVLSSYWRGGNDPPAGEIDLDPLWGDELPRLESLHVAAKTLSPGSLASKTLRELNLDGDVEPKQLAPLLKMSAPNLTSLTVVELSTPHAFFRDLVRSPLASKLATLAVSGDSLDPATVTVLTDNAKALAGIASLTLPFADMSAQAAIKKKLPKASFAAKRDPSRYVQTGE